MGIRAARMVSALLVAASASFAQAAEVNVVVARAFGPVLKQLGPSFERDTGHKLAVTTMTTAEIKKAIDSEEAFDLVVTNTPAIDDWGRNGTVVPEFSAAVAYSGLGLAVRAGARKPDISTVGASKATLLAAKSVAHSAASASAVAFQTLLARLGIAEEMRPRLRPMGAAEQSRAVGSGEVELLVAVVPSIVAASGLELAGLFPAELQTYTAFSAAVSARAKAPDAARAAILLLKSPAATKIFRSQGMESGAP